MGTLFLEVVTPEKVTVSQEVDMVVAPGSMGEFGVLEGHVPFLTGITGGELRFTVNDRAEHLAVTTGFAEVSSDRVSVLVDAAEMASDIDIARAQASIERARERLAKGRGTEEVDTVRAEAALRRAMMRIKIAEKGGQP